jgi:hypothetical protein
MYLIKTILLLIVYLLCSLPRVGLSSAGNLDHRGISILQLRTLPKLAQNQCLDLTALAFLSSQRLGCPLPKEGKDSVGFHALSACSLS